ncbi:MAG: hypothetical protein U5K77_03705 [Candidatus Saccharibacteria bacterium]|nr:hypothetical protein [Candidatus Saccharibacteria bacterium]
MESVYPDEVINLSEPLSPYLEKQITDNSTVARLWSERQPKPTPQPTRKPIEPNYTETQVPSSGIESYAATNEPTLLLGRLLDIKL